MHRLDKFLWLELGIEGIAVVTTVPRTVRWLLLDLLGASLWAGRAAGSRDSKPP